MARARGSRRRCRTRIAAVTCSGDGQPRPPPRTSSIHDLPGDLLELVLLRVRTPVCLYYAAAACKLLRRVITGDDGFLHRVRSLHQPSHLLGHYSVKPTRTEAGFCSTVAEFVPFPAVARPAIHHLRQRLSLDFLIDGEHMMHRWPVLTDSRGGLLAFVRDNWYAIVCDPWTRQYRELYFPWGRPEEDREYWYNCLGAFILDAGDGDGDEKGSLMSSFSVLCVCLIRDLMHDTTTAEACVFSARDNGWIRWTVSSDVYTFVTNMDMNERFVGRAGGSIFFCGIEDGRVLLAVDEATGDFSTITLPLALDDGYSLYVDRENLRVVNVVNGDDAGTLVRIVRLAKDDLVVLKVTRRAQHGGWECMVERSVGLCQLANIEFRADRSWRFLDTATTAAAAAVTLVLGAFSPSSTFLLFSLDIETMKLQPANEMTTTLDAKRVFPYELLWPQIIN